MDIGRALELAWHRIQNGQIDGAMDVLRQLLGNEPDLPEAHAYLALCLLNKKRLHAAEQEARMALALEPGLELTHYVLAHVGIAQRQFKMAREHIDQLLDMDPNHAPYYLLQADLAELTRNRKAVLPLLHKALELDPESSRVLAELSRYHAGKGELDMAERFARESLQHEPENVDGLVAMGHVLLQRGQIEAARDHAVWAIRHDPTNDMALRLMAGIKARQSPFLGLWWRYNVWMNKIGSTRSILVLLLAYVLYRILTMGFGDLGQQDAARIVHFAWLGFVVYTFMGPTLFEKSLKKELSDVTLSRDF